MIFKIALFFYVSFYAYPSHAEECSALLETGENLYEYNAQRFEKYYLSSSGFQNLNEFRNAVQATHQESLIQITQKLRLDQVIPVMLRSPSKRELILSLGFKNIHETGTSSMDNSMFADAPYGTSRRSVEASLLDLTRKEYAAVLPSYKPKSGFLIDEIQHLRDQWLENPAYGSDAWLFDIKKVEDQMTFTPGDSLNRAIRAANDPVLSDFQKGKRTDDNYEGADSLKYGKKLFKFLSWDLHYIPWTYREMLAPFLYFKKRKKLFFYENDQKYDGSDGIQNAYDGKRNNIPQSLLVGLPSPRASYVEVQFWRKLTATQVTGFVFFEEEPTLNFYSKLNRLGIQVLDGRRDRIKTYQPQY